MNTCKIGIKALILPALIAVLAITAALWSGQSESGTADAVITDLTIGLDMKSAQNDPGTYNINSLPVFEQCLDVKTNVANGIFYVDVFILNTTNLVAFNADIEFTAGKIQILESEVKKFFGTSASIQNLSRNAQANPPAVSPAVTDGVFFAGAVDTGSPHTGSGVLARLKAQGLPFGGGSVVDFRLDVQPAQSDGVTITDSSGAHPNSGPDGLYDGPWINQIGKIAVDRPDGDADGVSNDCDNCPSNANANQLNTDGDSMGNVCDTDDDNDGVPDASDNCPLVYNPSQNASACADADGDGVLDGNDNCPTTSNANQANYDNDSMGDACDPDDDNDGVLDVTDNCDFAVNPTQANWDGDGLGDACEDSDSDGWLDAVDNCRALPNPNQDNSDSDQYGNICDNCPTTSNNTQADVDGDLFGDACDDSDGDGYLDDQEVHTGTRWAQKCALSTLPNNEEPDFTPPDNNDSRSINTVDVGRYVGNLGKSLGQPGYQQRLDLTMNNVVNTVDVGRYVQILGTTCTP
jgi:Thrombospondin type 3 repeat